MYTDSIENWIASFEELLSFGDRIVDAKCEEFSLNTHTDANKDDLEKETTTSWSNSAVRSFYFVLFFERFLM